MRSATICLGTARRYSHQQVNHSSPKAEVTGSNPVGCASFTADWIASVGKGSGVCLRYWR
jgi:hypothetical protein